MFEIQFWAFAVFMTLIAIILIGEMSGLVDGVLRSI